MKKTIYVICIMLVVCLSMACIVQAITYENCHVIAVGRSAMIDIPVKTPYEGYLSYADFYNCSMLLIIGLPRPGRWVPGNGLCNMILAHPKNILLENTTGTFVWIPRHGTYINAEATTVVLEWEG